MTKNRVTKRKYKGMRVDGSGYNIGIKIYENGKVYIPNLPTAPKSEANRGYHYCDQVILESICRDTGIYDSKRTVVCIFDVLRHIETKEEFFIFNMIREEALLCYRIDDNIRNFKHPDNNINLKILDSNCIRITPVSINDYYVVGNLYDISYPLFMYLNIEGKHNTASNSLWHLLTPGNIFLTRANRLMILVKCIDGYQFISRDFKSIDTGKYNSDLTYKDHHNSDITKVYISDYHKNNSETYKWFYEGSLDKIKWDWIRRED